MKPWENLLDRDFLAPLLTLRRTVFFGLTNCGKQWSGSCTWTSRVTCPTSRFLVTVSILERTRATYLVFHFAHLPPRTRVRCPRQVPTYLTKGTYLRYLKYLLSFMQAT
ncbi:hypothetical protein VTK73DRAFT_464 [Phialemonium thermophilum]|uniref:Uncharacterized protein n=1 Tax=Phialemonium thermophilum TaxID=223376 RepID=A0ABR3VV04_9PEZI